MTYKTKQKNILFEIKENRESRKIYKIVNENEQIMTNTKEKQINHYVQLYNKF